MLRILLLVAALLLIGCTTAVKERPDLPEALGGNGLVVGELRGVGRYSGFTHGLAHIKGGTISKMAGGYIAQPLRPGDYELVFIEHSSGSGSSAVAGGGVTITNYQTLPIKRKFSVKAGQVTNLGQIVLIPDEKDSQGARFRYVFVDNTDDMRHFLRSFYPKLYASFGSADVELAAGDYERGEDLRRLRRYLAAAMVNPSTKSGSYVAGPAGTLAKIDRTANGNIKQVLLIDTPWVAGVALQSSHAEQQRAAIVTTDLRFYTYNSGRFEQCSLPSDKLPHRVFLFNENGIVAVDERFDVFTSQDDGRSWQNYSAAAADRSEYSRNDSLAEDVDGYYLLGEEPPHLLYAKYGSTAYQPVPLPKDVNNLAVITPVQSHLFLEREITPWTDKTPFPFYVRERTGGEWETRYKPKSMCGALQFLDRAGDKLRIQCRQEIFESSDGGRKWVLR